MEVLSVALHPSKPRDLVVVQAQLRCVAVACAGAELLVCIVCTTIYIIYIPDIRCNSHLYELKYHEYIHN